jgi:hypothetical protein
VERPEAEAIYAQGREPVVEVLPALSARLEAQDAQFAALADRVEEVCTASAARTAAARSAPSCRLGFRAAASVRSWRGPSRR